MLDEPWWKGANRARIALLKGMDKYIEDEAKCLANAYPDAAGKPVWLVDLPMGFVMMYAMMLMHFQSHLDNDDLKEMLRMALMGACEIGDRVIDEERKEEK